MLSANPIPIFKPIPPLTLRAEIDAPIIVKIKAEKIIAIRE